MKQILLTCIFLSSLIQPASSQFYIYSQYFDGADTAFYNSVNVQIMPAVSNIWQIGSPQKSIFHSAATLPNAIVTDTLNYYPPNNLSRFTVKTFHPVISWGVYAFQWMQKLDMDSDHDGGIVEFSVDGGVSWQNAFNNPYVYNFYGFSPANIDTLVTGEYAFSGSDTSWKNIWLCFDISWLNGFPDTIRFRFTFLSDSVNNNREGWLIDNMLAGHTNIHTVIETEQENYLAVFPNPAEKIVNIQVRKIMDFHIIELMELVDAKGRTVEKWKNIPTRFWFDTGKYPDGHYILKIKTNLKSESIPLVIRKK